MHARASCAEPELTAGGAPGPRHRLTGSPTRCRFSVYSPAMADRERSFWGWGYSDRFPGDEDRQAIAAMVSGLLGFKNLHLRPRPSAADIRLREPRVSAPAKLAPFCSTAPLDRAAHTYGKHYRDIVRGFALDFSSAPDVVARPADEAAIDALLDWCAHMGIAAIPFGGGTSFVGGVEGDVSERYRGVVTIDMSRFDRVLEVDPISRAACIQAGAMGPSLEQQLLPHGLTLRHYPQSFEFSTLGGWIATRAGGHYATLYTHIDDLVESVRMVTPSGLYESRRLPASGAGPSPDRFVLGSEGTLGIITQAWMRLQARPCFRLSASVGFDSFLAGAEALRKLAQSGLYPANCRLLDGREAMLQGVPTGGKAALLLLGFESADHPMDPWMDRALALCRDHGGEVSPDGVKRAQPGEGKAEREAVTAGWRQAFLDAPYHLNTLVSIGVIADTFETACTWDRFPALHQRVVEDVREAMKRVAATGIITCRITHVYPDGPAPYFTFLAPARTGSELVQWAEIKHAASEAVVAGGGTITHHHAVGRMHRAQYDRECPAPFAKALRAAKAALDPAAILNPGALIEP